MTSVGIRDLGARLEQTLRSSWPGVRVLELSELSGGASSLTYRAAMAGGPAAQVAVKVAPPGLAPVRNRDVLRQAAVLTRLAKVGHVRVPQVFGVDSGTPPEVPPFFVMSFEPGDSAEPLLTAAVVDPDHVASRARQAARMLAALHEVDVTGISEPHLDPAAEVDRWSTALATVPVDWVGGARDCAARLRTTTPVAEPAVLTHGDWRLGNTLCVGGEIRSVIDWEIWALADPRTDLAWFLTNCDPAHPVAVAGAETGMPPVADLLYDYERALGRPVADVGWFRALAIYKQAATTALIAKNAAKRRQPMEQVTGRMSRRLDDMFDWATTFLPPATRGVRSTRSIQ